MNSTLNLLRKKNCALFLSVLLCLLLYLAPVTCSASGTPEPVYQITETQLSMLEKRLNLLDQILAQQNPELTTLQLQLAESKKELATLRNELATSREQLTKAEDSLKNANLFLEKSAQEAKQQRLKIKAQRNGWIAATVLACIGLAIK